MAKLYFRYGVVGSAKTLNLLAVAHNYRQQHKEILLVKPSVDTRFGQSVIKTRAGLEAPADVIAYPDDAIMFPALDYISCILVDEAQFLTATQIEQLHHIAHSAVAPKSPGGIPVICYGLRTDFRKELFPASAKLLALADTIEEIKTTCVDCQKKAVFNLKLLDGLATLAGPSVELGAEEKYLPVCASCYDLRHLIATMHLTTEENAHV